MPELRKAALKFEQTKDFPTQADENKKAENRDYYKPIEYTSGHSYLPNYFLGAECWHGWKVTKDKYFDLTKDSNREELYIAAAEGRYFCNDPEPVNQVAKSAESPKTALELEIVDYSERAIAVIGNTKPYKDELKALGGRFNFRLSCGAGWIFPKTKQNEVENFINGQ